MAADPVSQRFSMTQEQFGRLSSHDQQRVVEAKIIDQALKPALDKATSRANEGRNQLEKALKGET